MFISSLLLVTSLHASAPVAHPAVSMPVPQRVEVGGCLQAACTGDDRVRICKCIPADQQQLPGITVDIGPHHLEWDTRIVEGEVTDFLVSSADLNGDGAAELIIASRSAEGGTPVARVYDLTIVDGVARSLTSAETHDFGPDAITPSSLLLTEWEAGPKGPVFVGREYAFVKGRLEPTRAPVLRRAFDPVFEQEREAAWLKREGLALAPRQFLSHPSCTKSHDEPAASVVVASVLGVTRDDGVLAVHLELASGALKMFSVDPEAALSLRLASAKTHALYPLRYSPADAESWLSGRTVRIALEADHLVGPLWLDSSVPVNQGPAPTQKP
jgi:hypothetical protein